MDEIRKTSEKNQILLTQAPTGIGKTVGALTVLLESTLDANNILFFVTSKQSQHSIVINTLKKIEETSGKQIKVVDIISKQSLCPEVPAEMSTFVFNGFCKELCSSQSCHYNQPKLDMAREMILSNIMHVHELKRICIRVHVCPHKAAQHALASANVVVCDYNYIFDNIAEPLLEAADKSLGDVLLVVDEAHNLPDRTRSSRSLDINSLSISDAIKEMAGKDPGMLRNTKAILKGLDGWAASMPINGEKYIDKFAFEDLINNILYETLGEEITLEKYINWLGEVGEDASITYMDRYHVLELMTFLEKWISIEKGVTRILSREKENFWKLKMAFLEIETVTGPVLAKVKSAVLMSGTLYPTSMYADILGVPKERLVQTVVKSPFPLQNRKAFGLRDLTTEFKKRDEEMYAKYAEALSDITRAVEGNIAAFFPSYQLLEDIKSKLNIQESKKEIIIESRSMTKKDREDVLEQLTQGEHRYLLLAVQGGGLSEGMDYAGNILSAIAIMGIQLAPPDLETKALVQHFKGLFGAALGNSYGYNAPAINKAVQSAGRLIRCEKDYGVVLLLDERFQRERFSSLMPPEMKPQMYDSSIELVSEVMTFFRDMKTKRNQ